MSSQNVPSTPAILAIVLGGLGLLCQVLGCVFGPFLCVAPVLCGASVVLGMSELGRVSKGESHPGNRPTALAGTALGGAGCGLGLLMGCLAAIGVGLYVAFAVLLIGAGAMA